MRKNTGMVSKKWRPNGWMNPYLQRNEMGDFVSSRCYEAGADAMLGALRKHKWCPYDYQWCTPLRGKIVIIPNDPPTVRRNKGE